MNQRSVVLITAVAALLAGFAAAKLLYSEPPLQIAALAPARFGVDAAPQPALSAFTAAAEIKKGGYILYFRHGQRQKWDSVIAFDVYEMATGANAAEASYRDAVCLTGQGKEEARMMGKVFELAKVQVGAVAASPVCRSRQTAELAFGRVDIVSAGLAHTPVVNQGNAASFTAELKRVLETIPVDPGKNAVITAHGNTLENNKPLFAEGTQMFGNPQLQETGFYMIKRDAAGKLRVVHKFLNLGEFAANAVDLRIGKP